MLFFIFCRLLDRTRKSRGDAKILVVSELCVFLLGNAIRSHFFLSNAGFRIFFSTELYCGVKNLPISFFLLFVGKVSNISYIFFHLCICV